MEKITCNYCAGMSEKEKKKVNHICYITEECSNCGENYESQYLHHAIDEKLGQLQFCDDCWNPK
jgi:hypothetical protein